MYLTLTISVSYLYHVLKRLTPVMVLIGKFLMGGDPPSKQVTLSVVTVVSGISMSVLASFCLQLPMYVPESCYLLLSARFNNKNNSSS